MTGSSITIFSCRYTMRLVSLLIGLLTCFTTSVNAAQSETARDLEDILTLFRDIAIIIAIIVIYICLCRVALSILVTAPEWLQVILIVVLSFLAYHGYQIIDSVVARDNRR